MSRRNYEEYIISPKSGRKILVRGKAYQDLLKDPKWRTKAQRTRKFRALAPDEKRSGVSRVGKVPTTKQAYRKGAKYKKKHTKAELLAKTPKSRKATRASAAKLKPGEGRGIRTRNWSLLAPQQGRPRDILYAECDAKGNVCFLRPESKGYPICPDVKFAEPGKPCQVSCKGVTAAKIRAAQGRHSPQGMRDPQVYKRATELERLYRC